MPYANHLSIYEYDDYSEVLKDLIEIRKSQGLPFSFRWFSQKAGFTSPNYLHLILTKRRHLSDDAVEKVAQIFRLTSKEADYFRLLVNFNKAKSPSSRAQIGQEILLLRSKVKIQYLENDQMNYYLSWQNIAVRECLLLNKDGLMPEELSPLIFPHPAIKEIHASLESLLRWNLVRKNISGRWEGVGGSISSGDRISSSALVTYHLQMIDLAKESLDRFSSEERDISNVSVPLSKNNFEKVRHMIQTLRAEILRLSDEDNSPELVAHLNFQLFPLAAKKETL